RRRIRRVGKTLVPALVVGLAIGRQVRGEVSVGGLGNVTFTIISVVGGNAFGIDYLLRHRFQLIQQRFQFLFVFRGLTDVAGHNQVGVHILAQLPIPRLLPTIVVGMHIPGGRVGKIDLFFVQGPRLRGLWFGAARLLACSLLLLATLGHLG